MKLTERRALADTAFAWTCAIATLGFLTTAVVIAANGGGWKVAETVIWAVLIGWLLLLTGKQRGQDDRIDGAVDIADRALGARQADAPTDEMPAAIHDLPRRPRPHPVADDADRALARFRFDGGRA